VPGLELWEDRSFSRNVRTPNGYAAIRLGFRSDHVHAELALHDMRDLAPTVARLRHLLDLDADPVGIDQALGIGHTETSEGQHDFVPGIRVPGCLDPAELLLRTMIGQQISLAAAAEHTARLVSAFNETGGSTPRLFPTPEAIAEHGAQVLTGPQRRVRAIVGAAEALANGDLVLTRGRTAAELRRDLLAMDGIGPWTADYVTMRLLADPDILLGTDLVVRKGATRTGIDLTETNRWAPWRSYLSMQLWHAALAARPNSAETKASNR